MSDPNAQTKKRQILIVGGAAFGILALAIAGTFFFDAGTPGPKRERPKTVSITAPGTVEDKDAWRAQQAAKEKANETLIVDIRSQLKSQETENQKLAKAVEELQRTPQKPKVDEAILSKPLPSGSPGVGQRVLQSPNRKNGPQEVGQLNQPLEQVALPPRRELEVIQFGVPDAKTGAGNSPGSVSNPTGSKREGIQFLPAGSFVRVAMLNGVDAPTGGQAQGNPLAVAFHVLDVANLANKYRLDIKDCRFIVAAWGDLSSERMMGRTETLACIDSHGETMEMEVKGQVIGEDGKAGVRGRLVTKQGQLLANALFAGALSGIGDAFKGAAATTTTGTAGISQTIDPSKVTQAALGGGVSAAGNMLADYYLKAADKLFPVIETDGGRVVDILITKGAIYNGKARNKDEYRNMLKRASNHTRSNEDD